MKWFKQVTGEEVDLELLCNNTLLNCRQKGMIGVGTEV